jgi:hypothetical protein
MPPEAVIACAFLRCLPIARGIGYPKYDAVPHRFEEVEVIEAAADDLI